MTEEVKNGSAVSDDIDLLLLIERIVLFFKKYKWIFLIATLAGITSGIYFYRSQPKIYTSRLIAHSFLLTNQEEIQIIDSWNQLLGKHEYPALASIFDCAENNLHPLKQIKGDEIQKVFSPNNPNGFLIEVNVTDISILDSLEPAVVRGLENNGYVKQRIASKRFNLNQQIDRTTRELKRLDSTKNIIENLIRTNQRPNSVSDLTSLNQQLTNLNEKLMNYSEELQFANAVQVLQGFNKINQPTGPKLFVWLFLGLLFFLSLAFVYTVINAINQNLRNRRGKK
jgi:hypothetical protein